MFTGFNVKLVGNLYQEYQKSGEISWNENKRIIKDSLRGFITDGIIDGTKVQEHWFPNVKADIFISHSHLDQNTAISLAGWIKDTFGLSCFVDSCIWGSADELLREIDDKYCYKSESGTYDYGERNFSTSHVHAILSSALMKMVDKTECIFLLNSTNSLSSAKNMIKGETNSPWIYLEIIMSELIRRRDLIEYRQGSLLEQKSFQKSIQDSLQIKYDVNLNHLLPIDDASFINWQRNKICYPLFNKHPLDYLYEIVAKK